MQQVVLIINPFATRVTSRLLARIIRVLRPISDLHVVVTDFQGHAQSVVHDYMERIKPGSASTDTSSSTAEAAGNRPAPIFVVFGGDGTVNEVVNGILGAPEDVFTTETPTLLAQEPLITVLPGGSANVFARSHGIVANPLHAAKRLARAIRLRTEGDVTTHVVRCGLGTTTPEGSSARWFLFNAGVGLDAEVVAGVEADRKAGHRATSLRYLRQLLPALRHARQNPPEIRPVVNGQSLGPLPFIFVSCTSPWTYWESVPVVTNPGLVKGRGLSLFSLPDFNYLTFLSRAPRLLLSKRNNDDHFWTMDSIPSVQLDISPASKLQIDGDYCGEFTRVTVNYHPSCVSILAP